MTADERRREFDVVVIGSGAGGGTAAYALAQAGLAVALVESGDFLPRERDNWSDQGAFGRKYTREERMSVNGKPWTGAEYAFVGGATKLYGAALYRYRELDFGEIRYPGCTSPAWPIGYADLEPWYARAELLYKVHGDASIDPTEGFRSSPYPFPPLPHDRSLAPMLARLAAAGTPVVPVPRAVDGHGHCILCSACDGFACYAHAKLDAEIACIRPALATGNLTLFTNTTCTRLETNATGDEVVAATVADGGGDVFELRGSAFVLAAGIFKSPLLLLRSASRQHPRGLGNSSGLVGKGLAGHVPGFVVVPDWKRKDDVHAKTWAVTKYTVPADDHDYPLGLLESLTTMPLWVYARALRRPVEALARRCTFAFFMAEMVPDDANGVSLAEDGTMALTYEYNNLAVFEQLRARVKRMFREAGIRGALTTGAIGGVWHPTGTLRSGADARRSVVDADCRVHDVANLHVADCSVMPSAGTVNGALSIMAQALRVADAVVRSCARRSRCAAGGARRAAAGT
jgi:choline dehydrogenase-like flavoprotein